MVRTALRNGYDRPKQRDRHPAAAPDCEADILAWIVRNSEKSTPVTRTDVLYYCAAKLSFSVTRGWVDCFTGNHLSVLTAAKSSPQEDPRLQVPRIFLDETLCCMQEAVHGRLSDLVFNLDEDGISE
jgi:hypothetical protein